MKTLFLTSISFIFVAKSQDKAMTTREEMEAKGLQPAETQHSGHRRARWHDYALPGIYMLTLVIEGRHPLFGSVEGCSRAARGSADYPHLHLSPFGKKVLEEEVPKIPKYYKMVEVWKVVLMPDHVHLLVCVREPLPRGRHLGHVVSGFKAGCTQAWWKWQDEQVALGDSGGAHGDHGGDALGRPFGHSNSGTVPPLVTVPEGSPEGPRSPEGNQARRPVLFERGYHDRIVRDADMLGNIHRYMDENPFRARLRAEIPHLMQRRLHLWIHDREYAAFGNLFLLKNPEKLQVFFHRKNAAGTPTHLTSEYVADRDRLLQRAEEGAVLVTPGISKGEQGVVTQAMLRHLPLIILQKEPISEFWKPAQSRFYACAAGHLLILAPWHVDGASDYARFHSLNDLARDICIATDTRLLGLA